eukprot:scaffold13468_cov128-Skeletonema_marinoi.AAC.3
MKLWIRSVMSQLDHYKVEHKSLLKEATTLLELPLWKANLDENEGGIIEQEGVRTTRGRRKRARKEICVTCGASIVIKNVEAKFEATATDTYLVRNRERDVHMWTDVYDWEKSRQGKVRVGRASSQKDGKALMCAYQYQLIYDITHSLTHSLQQVLDE